MEKDRIEQFLRDAADFCKNLKHAFKRLENEPENRDLIHQAFRHVHSLKSESQFLGLEELGAIAHEMEGVLEQIRRGTLAPDTESLGILFPMLDAFEEGLSGLSEGQAADLLSGGNEESSQGTESPKPVGSRRDDVPHFGEFERQLIREARARGERFFRLTCEIEESAPIKYPKAYLVVNNLEVETNVIRTVPSFETTEDDAYQVFSVYFTASLGEERIRSSIDVDQIKSVEIAEIAYRLLEEVGEVAPQRAPSNVRRGPSSVRIENGRLDEIQRRLREIETLTARVRKSVSVQPGDGAMESGLSRLSKAIPTVSRLVVEARSVPISDELRHLPWLVQDLATKLKKQVRLTIMGGSVKADRRLVSMLSEPLVHLVRNAVDHGIESPEERRASGKHTEGLVAISAVERDGELVLQVGDDGRGISEDAVRARATELGFRSGPEPAGARVGAEKADETSQPTGPGRLLDMLIRPGFSTRTEPTAVSGRGVGLDAIHQKIQFVLGGELRLQSQVGHGTLFTISLPGASTMLSLLMVRAGKETIGVPLRDVESVVEVEKGALDQGTDGYLLFGTRRVVGSEGRVDRSALATDTCSLILMNRERGDFAFMCDELLFERDLLEKQLTLGEEAKGGLRSIRMGNAKGDFLFLDVSAVE